MKPINGIINMDNDESAICTIPFIRVHNKHILNHIIILSISENEMYNI